MRIVQFIKSIFSKNRTTVLLDCSNGRNFFDFVNRVCIAISAIILVFALFQVVPLILLWSILAIMLVPLVIFSSGEINIIILSVQHWLDPRSIIVEMYDYQLQRYLSLAYPGKNGDYISYIYYTTRVGKCRLQNNGRINGFDSIYMWFWRPMDINLRVEMALKYDELPDIESLLKLKKDALFNAFIMDRDKYRR